MHVLGWRGLVLPVICVLASIAARADEPDKTFSLTNASESGLVVLGLDGYRTWTVNFFGYDPNTNRVVRNQGGQFEGFWPLFPEEVKLRYRFLAVQPGRYVIAAFMANRAFGCLTPKTLAFGVKPGQVSYIGNVAMDTENGARRLPDDIAGAQAALTAYPSVSAPLVLADRSEVNPEVHFRFVCTKTGTFRYVDRD